MGEIKFRAIPKEEFNNREIVLDSMAYYSQETEYDGTFIYGYLADGYIIGETIDADEDYYHPMFWVPIEKETVGQYTGLKDKNGKEIYEGDIVKVMDMTLAVVKYSKARGAYYLDCGNKIGDVGLICQYDTIEVLGNIFENPKLLEG